MSYQCHNRNFFEKSLQVQDGWLNTWARRMVDMEFRLDPSCVYSTSELGQKDEQCHGCRWKAGAGTSSPAEPVQVGNGLADLQPGESGPTGIAGQADVGRSADVAEHRSALEKAWPTSALYGPIEECPKGCTLAAMTNMSGRRCPYFHDGRCVERDCRLYQPTEE